VGVFYLLSHFICGVLSRELACKAVVSRLVSWCGVRLSPLGTSDNNWPIVRRGAAKSLAFPIFLFAAQPKEFFLDGLKKLEQRSHKCVELWGEYVE
jgi:hypothetical protein